MSTRSVAGQAVVVTGASSGIGEACALLLDARGFRVFAGVRREADRAHLAARASVRLCPVMLDVTDARAIEATVAVVAEAVGDAGLAGLVNNAGVVVAGPLEFLPIDHIREQLEVNLIGHMAVTRALIPLLRQGHGRVVNIGSTGGKVAMPFLGPYNASKFALEAVTDVLRLELAPSGIVVSMVRPNFVVTPLFDRARTRFEETVAELPAEAAARYGERMARSQRTYSSIGRNGSTPDEVAAVVLRALTAPKPRTRYAVGFRSRLISTLFAPLPDRLRDVAITRLLPRLARWL